MLLILPFLSLIQASALMHRKGLGLRSSYTASFLIHAFFVLLVSELLSLGNAFTPAGIKSVWLVPPLCFLLIERRESSNSLKTLFSHMHKRFLTLELNETILAAGIMILPALTLVVAAFGTPNNHDSMTYHLPRILIWLQNHGLEHFACDDFRLLYNPPLAELMQAHLWILCDGYLPAMNLAQWASYLSIAVSASIIAGWTGASTRTQLMAALFAATLPSSILEAPTTQNDLVMGAFLLAGFSLMLNTDLNFFKLNWTLGLLGISLAIATKATAFFFAPFLMAIPAVVALRRKRYSAVIAAVLILVPSTGWMSRNQHFFGSPLGYHDKTSMEQKINFYRNEKLTPSACLSSTAKNLSLFMATPVTALNAKAEALVRSISESVKVDADDPALTWYYQKYHLPVTGPHEDAPPVFWHFLLACSLCSLTFIKDIRNRQVSPATILSLTIIAGMCATSSYVKWMPWNLRFLSLWLIPLLAANINSLRPLAIDSPNHAISQSRNSSKSTVYSLQSSVSLTILCSLLLLASLPFACLSMRRSLVSFEVTIASQNLNFVSVFERDEALKLALDKQKAHELNELTGFAAGQIPSCITLVRHGVDPAIFPAMYLIKKNLPDVTYSFSNASILLNAPTNQFLTLSLDSPPPFDNTLYTQAFANQRGAVFVPSATPQK